MQAITDMKIQQVIDAILAYHPFLENYNGCDEVKCGDTSYIRDAVQLGKQKAMINLGHYNWEELGMKDMTKRVRELVGEQVEVSYVPSEDLYSFF